MKRTLMMTVAALALAAGSTVAMSQGGSGRMEGGASGGATVNQPAIDINQAQQPGVGVNSGASGGGSIPQPGR